MIEPYYKYCPNCGQAIRYSTIWSSKEADEEYGKILEAFKDKPELFEACKLYREQWRRIYRAIVFGDPVK